MRPARSMPSVPLIAALLGAVSLCGCDRAPSGPTDQASVQRVAEIRPLVDADLDTLKKSGCADQAAVARLDQLGRELASKHAGVSDTPSLLRRMMEAPCAPVQAAAAVNIRFLRPRFEAKAPPNDVVEALAAGLTSTDPTVRTVSALSVHELHIDPRGTKLPGLLKTVSTSDTDPKARTTAAWVIEQIAKAFPDR